MTRNREQQYRQIAARSKYQRLYTHLCGLAAQEWRTSFSEIEALLGFALPASARLHRPWWANQPAGNGHSQALSWSAAGWETAEVDMEAETLLLRRKPPAGVQPLSLDAVWPVHAAGPVEFDLKEDQVLFTLAERRARAVGAALDLPVAVRWERVFPDTLGAVRGQGEWHQPFPYPQTGQDWRKWG